MVTHGFLLPTRLSVMASDTPSTLAAKTESDIVSLAGRAESLRFDSVWVGDSVLAKPRHEPLTTLAAIATETESVFLGTAVYLPPLRDPVNVAHLAATVDHLSGGRLCLGVGSGSTGNLGSSVKHEYEEMGIPWDDRGDLLDEQLDVITGLWEGEVEYDGDFLSYDGASIGFEPVRSPPVLVGSTVHETKGVLEAVRERVAAHGDGWFPAMASADALAHAREQIDATLETAGRDPDSVETVYYQDVLIADSEEEALDKERAFIEEYYPGMSVTDDELRRRGVFGPPEEVADHLAEYEAAGVDRFVTRFPIENQREQLQRYATLFD